MGSWSVDVFGGDTPLDVLGEIGELIGFPDLYPVEDVEDRDGVRAALELQEDRISSFFAKSGYDEDDYLPVWAAVVMSVGGTLSDTLRERAARAADTLAANAQYWSVPEEREAYMSKMATMIRTYKRGDKVDFEHKGLFQTMAEKMGDRS
jgi:hypothetical protein